MSEIELQKKASIAIAPLGHHLDSLGYTRGTVETKKLGSSNSVKYQYHHEVYGRVINVFAMERLGVEAFIHQNLDGDKFSLSDYLKWKSKGKTRDLAVRKDDETWERYAERCVRTIVHIFELDLRKVVRGEEWMSVPIDWSIAGR